MAKSSQNSRGTGFAGPLAVSPPTGEGEDAQRRSGAEGASYNECVTRGVYAMDSLQGKVVLITGGARRVGAAIARRLHKSGANLMLHHRASVADARKLQTELNAARPGSVSWTRV